jgi:hypothetical protein
MSDIVLVPTYFRPEYLSLCLEHLSKATGIEGKEIWVCQDFRENDEYRHMLEMQWTAAVIDQWKEKLPIRFIRRGKHSFSGNSCNVLNSYKEAFNTDARFVYLVEDDVLVMPDFFQWHEAVQADGDYWCSIAYRCSRNSEARKDVTDPNAYFTTCRDYASIGVCWKREHLGPIVAHAKEEYFAAMESYMTTVFKGNRFAGDFAEQDGLIMRVMWNQRATTAWPFIPRCFHMGWYGYHRPNGFRPNGHLDQKISALRGLISDPARLKDAAPDFGDIEPFPTTPVEPWSKLYKVQHFD